jgi:PTH1 family peptidyl-tRNA hydrolase
VLRKDAKFQALVGRHEASGAWLVLPQNFMNASGRPVQMLAGFFKIAPGEILVAHDELDFPPGVVRMKQGGGVAGHNGLKDVSARLGSHEYWRLRIGIGHPGDRNAVTEYVLHKAAQEERGEIDAAIGRALEVLPLVLAGDVQGAMLKLHSAPEPAPKPVTAEQPTAPRTSGSPEKPRRAPKAEAATRTGEAVQTRQPETPAKVETPGKPEKAGGLGSFLKKFLPGSDRARKK